MTIDGLKQFMLSQGPSQATTLLEYDSIWATNKKIIDPIAPRYWAIVKDKAVKVTINGAPSTAEVKSLPRHKKNSDLGAKDKTYTSTIYIEQEDAASFEDQEEITLMDWGNAIIKSKETNTEGIITSITADLHLEGDFKKTKKKITWLSSSTPTHPIIVVTLLDYDYLITKKKLEEEDKVDDFVTPVSEFRVDACTDSGIHDLKKGDIIQFERKGYYILDSISGEGDSKKLEFIRIPDGKAAGVASKAATATEGGKVKGNPDEQVIGTTASGFNIAVTTKMYRMPRVLGEGDVKATVDTKMYPVDPIN
jgi:glutamyl-tRNA synthetase